MLHIAARNGRLGIECRVFRNGFVSQRAYCGFGVRDKRPAVSRSHYNILFSGRVGKRTLFAGVSPLVLVPSIFVGLLLGHWVHKCLLMVLFQNKIIYMPSLPPGSRRERLENYANTWGPIAWEERKIKSLDGTNLAVAIAQLKEASYPSGPDKTHRKGRVILYFQGNGASLPPRTPMLSNILRSVSAGSEDNFVLIGLSYRGYWTSSGRAHQKGIEKDAEAFVSWVIDTYCSTSDSDTEIILWGQSIGSGVAAFAAAKYVGRQSERIGYESAKPCISHLILETPFLSIKSMLAALYPDWWVPYRHLWPFLRSWWDSEEALNKIASVQRPPKVLMLVASRDEIVPAVQADQLEKLCRDLQLDLQRHDVLGALHHQTSTLERGKKAIVDFLKNTPVV